VKQSPIEIPHPAALPLVLLLALSAASAAAANAGAADAPDAAGTPAVEARGRADENAVRQAQDAFGTSVGRETIGLYSAALVRGFSPIAAGNARIEGLYFDQVWAPSPRMRRSSTVRVGIAALGYPFPAPTGIVDYALRKPGAEAKLSVVAGADSYGATFVETDAELPLAGRRLSLGFGASASHNEYPSGVGGQYRNAALALRWNPVAAVEIVPFWHRSEGFDHEKAPLYLPAGAALPPRIERRRFHGPHWADYRGSAVNYGLLTGARAGGGWNVRAGVFRSLYDDQRGFSHLLTNITPDGRADRVLIADPPYKNASTSGEVRLSHALDAGAGQWLHGLHASVRARDRGRRYDGSQRIELGPTTITSAFLGAEPVYRFGPQTRDRTRQWTAGLAYEGSWRGVGEAGFSVQKTDYRKHLERPGFAPAQTRDQPWLYNATAALHLSGLLVAFAGHTRGLEESGVAPDTARNRNELLPAVGTAQSDIGLRYTLAPGLRVVAAAFDVRKPYFNFDAANRYALLGDVANRGIELSLAGALTPRLNIVTGAVLSRPRATGEGVRLGRVGPRPVGLARRSVELNLDWRTPWLEALSLDMTASHSGAVTATVDNRVALQARTIVGVSGRYRFNVMARPATLRVALNNLSDVYGYDLKGAGAYEVIAGRLASAYLSVDF
jgi:iron complex outermembrane receptor protein